jgi:hypothetical protein
MTPEQILNELHYISFAANREYVSLQTLSKVYGPIASEFESRYLAERLSLERVAS